MSSTFQAVVRGPSLTGLGNRPVFTPAHHVDRPIGIGPVGARIAERRTKPKSGRVLLAFIRFGHPFSDNESPMFQRKTSKGASESR
jgi:hypothetical protein